MKVALHQLLSHYMYSIMNEMLKALTDCLHRESAMFCMFEQQPGDLWAQEMRAHEVQAGEYQW